MSSNSNTECTNYLIEEYISTMTEQERLVLKIATEHLESSFSIERSIGYLEWLSKRPTKDD
jgi:hypothetical protein|tara:strand:- start:125 stop:307 length:183 start_codon:yes stop_codon:yes gene_type:complete